MTVSQAQADVADFHSDDDKISRQSESSTSSPVKGNFEQYFERSLLVSSPRAPSKENVASTSLRKALSHSALPAAFLSEKQGNFFTYAVRLMSRESSVEGSQLI